MSKKRDSIIQAATTLFNEKGYNAAGIDLIIKESGVAKMTFYKYFASKEVLIAECLTARNNQLQADIMQAMDACTETPNALYRLKALFFWYKNWFESVDFYGCMFQKAIDEAFPQYPLSKAPTIAYKDWLLNTVVHELKQLKVKEPKDMAVLMVSLLSGLTNEHQMQAKKINMNQIWHYVAQLIKHNQ